MEHTFEVNLAQQQIELFRSRGFLSLDRITTAGEIERIRGLYDRIVRDRVGCRPSEMTGSRWREESLVTIVSPEAIAPELKESIAFLNAREVLTRLLGVSREEIICGWRIFCKPPHGGVTPWHQDAANRPRPHDGASVWIPLDDATEESSCLSYIGGSHRTGLRPHHFEEHHFLTDDVDGSQGEATPVPAGGATVHHCLTLHSAGANRTDRPRRALVVVGQVVSRRENPI
jgi:hypothetical protein